MTHAAPASPAYDARNRLATRAATIVLAGLSVMLVAVILYITVGHALYFDGYFANGTFQLLNVLRRVMDGQLAGRDFFVFHGAGTIWAHMPLYLLFGQSIEAVQVSKYLTSALLHAGASIWLWLALRRRIGTVEAAGLALYFFAAVALVLDHIVFPANALLGARSVFPIFVGLALLSGSSLTVLSMLIGGALFMSTEHGLAALLAAVGTALVVVLIPGRRVDAGRLALASLIGLAGYLALSWASAGGQLLPELTLRFRDIPGDQFWYFGVRPNWYFPGFTGHFDWQYIATLVLFLLAAGSLIFMLAAGSAYLVPAAYLTAYAIVGNVSQLGYLSSGNLDASERALILVLILMAAQLHAWRHLYAIKIVALVALAFWFNEQRLSFHWSWPEPRDKAGETLSAYWRTHTEAVLKLADGRSLWSAYAGLPEFTRGTFQPSADYIIHALGPVNRARYSAAFDAERPFVVRLDNAATWRYGWWLINANWDFYRRVFKRYDLVFDDRMASVWRLADRDAGADGDPLDLPVADNCFDVREDRGLPTVYSVRLTYAVQNPMAALPVIGLTPRLIIDSGRSNDIGTSLPPPRIYGGTWEYPIFLKPNETLRFCGRVDTFLPGVGLTIQSAAVSRAAMTPTAARYVALLWE